MDYLSKIKKSTDRIQRTGVRRIIEEEPVDHIGGCHYGQPDGPDDFITECECGYNEEE